MKELKQKIVDLLELYSDNPSNVGEERQVAIQILSLFSQWLGENMPKEKEVEGDRIYPMGVPEYNYGYNQAIKELKDKLQNEK